MSAEIEMQTIPSVLDKAKSAAHDVLERYKTHPNIAKTLADLEKGKQVGEFQDDTYAYITKPDFDALKALTDEYAVILDKNDNNYERTQYQILLELLNGIKGKHPEFSGGSKKRSNKHSKKHSKKNRRGRTTFHRRRSRARR